MEPLRERLDGAVSTARAMLQRGAARTGVVVVVIGLIFGAVVFGLRIPGDGLLPGLPRLTQSEYSTGVIGSLAPLKEDFVRRALGAAAYRDLAGPPPSAVAEVSARLERPASPHNVDGPPPPTIEGAPGFVPGLSPGGWVLTLDMVAASSTVQAGDEINYQMFIRNVGTGDFTRRSFLLEWHTPLGTVGSAPGPCDTVPSVDLQRLCDGVLIPQPGRGDAAHEQRDSRGLITIRAGQQWVQEWHVQIPPATPAGTQYTNHAHLHVTVGGQEQTITTPMITVTVVA